MDGLAACACMCPHLFLPIPPLPQLLQPSQLRTCLPARLPACRKLNLGLGAYGRSWVLQNKQSSLLGARATDVGPAARCTGEWDGRCCPAGQIAHERQLRNVAPPRQQRPPRQHLRKHTQWHARLAAWHAYLAPTPAARALPSLPLPLCPGGCSPSLSAALLALFFPSSLQERRATLRGMRSGR